MNNANTLRRVNWLWKHRHTHDGDTLQEQITVIRETVEKHEEGLGAAGSGAFIHLVRSAPQEIAVGGEPVEWDAAYNLIPASLFTDEPPVTSVSIKKESYYNVAVQLGWDTFEAGGSVWVTRTREGVEVTVWPPDTDPGLWTTDNGQMFEGVAPAISCKHGDTISVYVDADDASAQNLASATLAVYLVDRIDAARARYQTVVLADGPLAYWRLGEASGTTATDATGNIYDGTYENTPTLGAEPVMTDGFGDKAVDFARASSERVDLTDQADFEFAGSDVFSVEAWVDLDLVGSNGTVYEILSKLASTGVSDQDGWTLHAVSDGSALRFEFERWSGTSQNSAEESSYIRTTGTRHYVAGTYDGTTARLYVNGVEVATDDTAVSLPATTVKAYIGAAIGGGSPQSHFDGRIDEVAIYDKVLTAGEVAHHYLVGIGAG
jgi:hypothetical protein